MADPKIEPEAPVAVSVPDDPQGGRLSQTTGKLVTGVQGWREKHPILEMVLAFSAGFLFDVVTLGRIDDWTNWASQAVYLGLLAVLLGLEQRYALTEDEPPRLLKKVWKWSDDILHFFLGSLLSAFTLFYFKSASGLLGLAFLVGIAALLIANELPGFRKRGPLIRFGLFAFCVATFFAYLVPTLVGFLSVWLFLLSMALTAGALFLHFKLLVRWTKDSKEMLKRQALPSALVIALLTALYFGNAIPPLPLSIQYIGIFHDVQRDPVGGGYRLSHERPAWKLWQSGDQLFRARPGDKVWCFVRVFAPRNFQDKVYVRWLYDDPKKGWTDWGNPYPLEVRGKPGELGFATFANKANFKPGDWRVDVETADGRVVGGIKFTIEEDPTPATEPRAFFVEKR